MRTDATIGLLFLLFGACGCSSSDGGTPSSATDSAIAEGGETSTATPRTPAVHRAAAASCPTTRDPGHAEPGFPGCKTDDECKDGNNGRCLGTLGAGNVCSYDACVVDGDCGSAGVCDCRNSIQHSANSCFKGNCRTDADCKGDFCSPSGVTTDPSCMGIPIGAFGFFCHGAADACRDDSDCTGVEPKCIFDPDVLHWRCASLECPG